MSRRSAFKIAFGVVAVAGPAFAADPYYPHVPAGSPLYQPASIITANMDVAGGLAFGSGTDASGTAGALAGVGRVNIVLHDAWNLQVDVEASGTSSYSILGTTNNMDHLNGGLTAYLYKRSGGLAYGPYVSFAKQASGDAHDAVFGIFCDPIFGPWELHGGVHAGWVSTGPNNNGTIYGVQAGAQYWLDNNTVIGGDVMYNNVNVPGVNKNIWTLAANALHRFDGMPIAVFGSARLDNYSGTTSASLATVMIGTRFYINPMAPDARTDMQNGPAFTTRLALPANL